MRRRLQRLLKWPQRLDRRVRRAFWPSRSKHFPVCPDGTFLLHVGCGEIAAPEFVNIDARPYPHVHIVTRSLFDLRAVPDRVASLVYMCHVLEHVPRGEVRSVLTEMRRVLVPGGTLRISVPDFDLILKMYEDTGKDIDAIAGPLMGGQDYRFNFHYSVFSASNLSRELTAAGFFAVRAWNPASSAHHDFDDWAGNTIPLSGRDFPVSLNLEATAGA